MYWQSSAEPLGTPATAVLSCSPSRVATARLFCSQGISTPFPSKATCPLGARAAWCTASVSAPNPPAVSSNGNSDGVLWVTGASTGIGNTPVLRAYEISTGMEVYGNTTPPPSVRQWVPPVVADGRVYVTGASSVYMYRMQ